MNTGSSLMRLPAPVVLVLAKHATRPEACKVMPSGASWKDAKVVGMVLGQHHENCAERQQVQTRHWLGELLGKRAEAGTHAVQPGSTDSASATRGGLSSSATFITVPEQKTS